MDMVEFGGNYTLLYSLTLPIHCVRRPKSLSSFSMYSCEQILWPKQDSRCKDLAQHCPDGIGFFFPPVSYGGGETALEYASVDDIGADVATDISKVIKKSLV